MKIGIIGCGTMGAAFAKKLADSHEILLYDAIEEKSAQLSAELKAACCSSLEEMAKDAQIILLAIKPQDLENAADQIAGLIQKNQWIMSILAGISLDVLRKQFPQGKIVRLMPNLPLIYGKGIIGLSSDEKNLPEIFNELGHLVILPEDKIDALTSLTGSGPAFFLLIFEAIVDVAVQMGFASSQANELALEMIEGSVELLKQSKSHPSVLRNQISSPGGTTIYGLNAMKKEGIHSAIGAGFLAALKRAKELG